MAWWNRLARRRGWWIAAAAVAPVLLRLAILPWRPVPRPAVHDEFSYLLGADTLASGRLVNPAHPMRRYFETFHVQLEPTYVSKYLPGQAAMLGAGQAVAGHPWAGVLLGVAGMGAAIAWMLYGWLPPRWALLGTSLAVAHFSLFTYWTDSYWGGALPAAAGALMFGAFPRLRRRVRARDGLALSAGLALLMVSRPYEGLALSIPVMAALMARSWKRRSFRWVLYAMPLPLAAAGGIAYYNYRATGDAATLPYRLHEQRYGVAPLFIVGSLRQPPSYTDERFRRYWAEWDVSIYHAVRSSGWEFFKWKWQSGGAYYFRSWPSIAAMLLFPLLLFWRRARFPVLAAGVFAGALLLEKAVLAHYAAPGAALMILLTVYAMMLLGRWRPGGVAVGRALAVVLAGGWIGLFLLNFARRPTPSPLFEEFLRQRARVEEMLDSRPGNHLVVVRYEPGHEFHHEWIYNRADIDGSRIVWARDDGEGNGPLVSYFRGRTAWLLQPDRPGLAIKQLGETADSGL